jgi:hypothetical protein
MDHEHLAEVTEEEFFGVLRLHARDSPLSKATGAPNRPSYRRETWIISIT